MRIAWTRGETREYGVVPRDGAGASSGGTYSQAQLRIGTPPSCTIIEGVRRDLDDGNGVASGFVFPLDAASLGSAGTGVLPAAIWLRHAAGWECAADDLQLYIKEIC